MSNTATYFKWGTLLVGIAVVVWLTLQIKGCVSGSGSGSNKDTISVKHDTTYITKRDTITQTLETLVPYKVEYVKTVVKHDTLTSIEFVTTEADTTRILEQYFATKFYSITSPVQYGEATIHDTITQNRITGRSIILSQSIPQVKETITIRERRVVLYGGIIAFGNKENIPFASGVTLDLKFKNDALFGVGGLLTRDKPMFQASLKVPIRLRKR